MIVFGRMRGLVCVLWVLSQTVVVDFDQFVFANEPLYAIGLSA